MNNTHLWIWSMYDDPQGSLTHWSSHTDQICLSRSQIQWVSHLWPWVFSCLPDYWSWRRHQERKESWFLFWTRGWEALGGWEGKGRAVPGNTVREKFPFVFPGRTDYGSMPHSCPVIHTGCDVYQIGRRHAWLEQSDWKLMVQLCRSILYFDSCVVIIYCSRLMLMRYNATCKETSAHIQTFWIM